MYVDPNKVEPVTLADILTPEALPAGFELLSEQHGYENWHPSGRAAYSARLFANAAGERIAVQVTAMGSRWASQYLERTDALCRRWPDGECDGQYNTYRY